MKLSGKELHEHDNVSLLKHSKLYLVCAPILLLFAAFFASVLFMPMDDDMRAAVILFGVAGMSAFSIVAIVLIVQVFNIKKELKKRNVSEVERAEASGSLKGILIFSITIIVVGILIVSCTATGGCSCSSSSSDKCTICGKFATNKFQGSGYCAEHYDTAVKWAVDNVD